MLCQINVDRGLRIGRAVALLYISVDATLIIDGAGEEGRGGEDDVIRVDMSVVLLLMSRVVLWSFCNKVFLSCKDVESTEDDDVTDWYCCCSLLLAGFSANATYLATAEDDVGKEEEVEEEDNVDVCGCVERMLILAPVGKLNERN